MHIPFAILFAATLIAPAGAVQAFEVEGSAGSRIEAIQISRFDEPWAMAFLPSGELLVTEKPGRLLIVDPAKRSKIAVSGVPEVDYRGQGGLGDVVLHPGFAANSRIYLSYAEEGPGGTRGAAVAMAVLARDGDKAALEDLQVIWRQQPKVTGAGHYSHRIAFGPDGKLFIASGERQKFTPAQDMDANLGKIVRLNDDGSTPPDNPFQDQGELARTFWSIGHRNILGLAFDASGNLWEHEMGPRGGDEINLISAGRNYGWPVVSNGDHYNGDPIPDHPTRPEFAPPEAFWNPVIAPAGLVIYSGDSFPQWRGDALIGGLVSRGLVRVSLDPAAAPGARAREVERIPMGERIREVEQGPDGAVWLLEDDAGGRLLKLLPAK